MQNAVEYEAPAVCFCYSISPKIHDALSGGELVILKFIKLLNARGIKSALFFAGEAPDSDIVPFANALSPNTVVVYSEGVWGNLLNAKRVCRWMLYDPYKIRGQDLIDTWDKTDVLCSYGNYDCGLQCNISVNVVDFKEDIFTMTISPTDRNNKTKKYFLIHKAQLNGWGQEEFYAEITILTQLGFEEFQIVQPEKMNTLMQNCCIFVSFDLNTYISNIAVLCGALSLIKKPKTDTRSYKDILEKRGSYGSIGIRGFDSVLLDAPYDYEERLRESNLYREYTKTANNIDEFVNRFSL